MDAGSGHVAADLEAGAAELQAFGVRVRVGFTGTRMGMDTTQKLLLRSLLVFCKASVLHHGDCKGADEEAATIAQSLGIPTVSHPCNIEGWRAHTEGNAAEWPVRAPDVRNREIVSVSDLVVAAPAELGEQLRSGTWATWRYAKKHLDAGAVMVLPRLAGLAGQPAPSRLNVPS